ncbi:hypothetical protein GP486_007656 [Trichoglossum hirsutum]|uniref:Uncharacterized protein n=1 Tax=Trichoglossum hirsutum TaxID=265104 RepID=A0A9P8L6Q6_9PEZI|nr:hypothetical protein GP486_007656 [Trichoglossum hirsutum]
MLIWLPKEIINVIYALVLRYPVPIHFYKESTFYSQFHGPPDLSLLRVSHYVREDALAVFARVNTFVLNTANGIPRQWMGDRFLGRLSKAEFIFPLHKGIVNHEKEVLELLKHLQIYVTQGARIRFVIESRDGSVMRRSNPVLKLLACLQHRTTQGWVRPVVSFEEHRELVWPVQKIVNVI